MGARLTASVSELELRIRDADRIIATGAQAGPTALSEALIDKGEAHQDLRDHQSAEHAFEHAAAASSGHASHDGHLSELHALGLALQAGELVRLKQPDEGLVVSRRALTVLEDANGPVARRALATALIAETSALLRLDRPGEALEVCNRTVDGFATDPIQGPKRTNIVASARVGRARALMALDRPSEADAELVTLCEDYAADQEPAVQLMLGRARAQRAKALITLGRKAEAAEIRRDLLDAYIDSDEPRLRELAAGVGLQLSVSLLKDKEAEAALALLNRVQPMWDFNGLPGIAGSETALALLSAQAQLQLKQAAEAVKTLERLIARPDLVTAPTDRTRLIARLVSDAADQLIETDSAGQALEAVNNALTRLGPVAPDPDDLARLWRRKLQLLRDSPTEALAACEEIAAIFAQRTTAQGRASIVHTASAKAAALLSLGKAREGLTVAQEAIVTFTNDPEITVRAQVAALMAIKAEIELGRHRPRTALRTYRDLRDFCGENPPELLQRQADLARTRTASITSDRADRQQRLSTLALVVAIWTAPAVLSLVRATHRPRPSTRKVRVH